MLGAAFPPDCLACFFCGGGGVAGRGEKPGGGEELSSGVFNGQCVGVIGGVVTAADGTAVSSAHLCGGLFECVDGGAEVVQECGDFIGVGSSEVCFR